MNHHRDRGSESDTFNDPGGWNKASYTPDFLAELGEPLPDPVNDYREAALHFLGIMYAIDQFFETAVDARLATIAVSITLAWPSTRGLTVPEIAKQLGTTPATITRACARFREIAGLHAGGGSSVDKYSPRARPYRMVKSTPSKS